MQGRRAFANMKATLDEGLNSYIRPNKKKQLNFLNLQGPLKKKLRKGSCMDPSK